MLRFVSGFSSFFGFSYTTERKAKRKNWVVTCQSDRQVCFPWPFYVWSWRHFAVQCRWTVWKLLLLSIHVDTQRERPLMTSNDFRRFLTYLPTLFNPKTSDFLGHFEPPYLPKNRTSLMDVPKPYCQAENLCSCFCPCCYSSSKGKNKSFFQLDRWLPNLFR